MLYAWVDGVKRAPVKKGERTICRACGGLLTSVVPAENVAHWRHKAGDCDRWSEPEGPWHLGWKELFDISCREIPLEDSKTGERHRADVLCGAGSSRATVLELQHSPISEDERNARERFYQQNHRMFWLVHVHSESSFLGHNFGWSINFRDRPLVLDGKTFGVMSWMGGSKQFIEKWKRATAHVFFEWNGLIYYLVNAQFALDSGISLNRGEFALCMLTQEEFVRAVHWAD